MSCDLVALSLAATDPAVPARFWAALLGWDEPELRGDEAVLVPGDDTGFELRFRPSPLAKVGQNPRHLDLTSTSPAHQEQTVARVLALGGRHADVGQGPESSHVVMADPEGNELCVIEPGNGFLAGCGFVGALACDGSREVGCFWSEALGWPLVWDQDQETAVRAPYGGPMLTWGGYVRSRVEPDRLIFVLAPSTGGDVATEVDRLVALGARRDDRGDEDLQGDRTGVRLLDPDGHEFRLCPRDRAREGGRPC